MNSAAAIATLLSTQDVLIERHLARVGRIHMMSTPSHVPPMKPAKPVPSQGPMQPAKPAGWPAPTPTPQKGPGYQGDPTL